MKIVVEGNIWRSVGSGIDKGCDHGTFLVLEQSGHYLRFGIYVHSTG